MRAPGDDSDDKPVSPAAADAERSAFHRCRLPRPAATCWVGAWALPSCLGALLVCLAALLTLFSLPHSSFGSEPLRHLRPLLPAGGALVNGSQLLDASTFFMLLSSSALPGTLALLHQLEADLGPGRAVLVFDDTLAPWTLSPAQRITKPHRPFGPNVLLFNRQEADALSGSLAGAGGMDYFGVPVLALLFRHLDGSGPFQQLWRIEVLVAGVERCVPNACICQLRLSVPRCSRHCCYAE